MPTRRSNVSVITGSVMRFTASSIAIALRSASMWLAWRSMISEETNSATTATPTEAIETVCSSVTAPLRGREPGVDAALQHVERQRARAEHDLVEGAQIEALPELLAGAVAQRENLELSELVRARLAGVRDVAVDLVDHVEPRLRGVVEEVRDGAVTRPAERMHPGVDDEPDGAPHLVAERPELRLRVVVHADRVAERLGVQPPPFREADVVRRAPEARHRAELGRKR